jgi:hypothetical protein
MQLLEVSWAVRPIYGSLGAKGLRVNASKCFGRYSIIFRGLCTVALWCNCVRRICVDCVRPARSQLAYPGIFFGGGGGGGCTNSVEDRGQRERGSGGGSTLVFFIALVSSVSCTFCSRVLFVSYRTACCGFFHYEQSDGFGGERTRDLGFQRPLVRGSTQFADVWNPYCD